MLDATNLSHPKNIDALHGECDKLGARIARLAFIRATMFVLFIFSLASAFEAISSNDVPGIVARIKDLREITRARPPLDLFLTAIYFPRDSAPEPEEPETSSTFVEATPLSEETLTKAIANAAITALSPGGTSDAEAKPPSPAEVEAKAKLEKAQKEQAELAAQLTEIARKAFTFSFKAPLLGTEINLDLRVWAFILPFCFIFWEVHLSVQRHKLRTLQRIAGVVAARTPGDATILDHLLFRREGRRSAAFSRHPAQFELVVSLIGGVALIIYLCWEGYDFWQGADPHSTRQLIELYGFVIVYAVGYGSYVSRQINAEAMTVGVEPAMSYLGRLLSFVRLRLSACSRRLWPEVNLVTGSTMVIGTLWLLVGAPFGCDARTGMEYLHRPEGWLVGPVCGLGALAKWHNLLVATLYGMGLAAAGFTLVMLLVSLARRRRLGAGATPLGLAKATTALALFFLTDLAVGQLLDLPYSLPALFLWLIPMWIGWRWAHSKQGALRADWPRVQRSLFYWYAPQAAVAAIVSAGTLFEEHPLVGVPVFVCGLATLALGYWNARAQAQARAAPEANHVS